MVDLTQYHAAAPNMKPGDVLAFAGVSFPLSWIIRGYTGARLSHVAMVQQPLTADSGVPIAESTIFTDANGKKLSGPGRTHLGGSSRWTMPRKAPAPSNKCENGSVTYHNPSPITHNPSPYFL